MLIKPWELLAGVSLDLLIGDPQWLPHPVRAIGKLATFAEAFWRKTGLPPRLAGLLFWITVTTVSAVAVWMTTPWANVYWIYALLACRDLDVESGHVIHALENQDLEDARAKLARIVGRDTQSL